MGALFRLASGLRDAYDESERKNGKFRYRNGAGSSVGFAFGSTWTMKIKSSIGFGGFVLLGPLGMRLLP